MTTFKAPRGAGDVLPPASELQERVARTCEDLFRLYGYRRIETPPFENAEVFSRSLDSRSDLVTKEMYTFQDKGDRTLALRPEGTAGVVRAVLEHHLHRSEVPVKLYYTGSMFRHERPQAGRSRAFRQAGVEALGVGEPSIDAEIVTLGSRVFAALGLDITLRINSIGHPVCRGAYLPRLVAFLEAHSAELCKDCTRKITTNPLRTFDCKVPEDRELMKSAPLISEHLCDECAEHFAEVRLLLGQSDVTFDLDPRLVRGLDYYTRTTFAFVAPKLGAQDEVCGGGRYDGLAELLGGEPLPGIGFALGVDRVALALEEEGASAPERVAVFVIGIGEGAGREALGLATRLRDAGIACDLDFGFRSAKAQFRMADKLGAPFAVILGDREMAEESVTVRNMRTGEETKLPGDRLVTHLREQL